MLRKLFSMIAILVTASLAGCGHPAPSTGSASGTPAPTTQPLAVNPTPVDNGNPQTQPVAVVPQIAPSGMLLIAGSPTTFPSSTLRLTVSDGAVTARLTTDDPKEALLPGYTGNSFDLDMPLLDISDPSDLQHANWTYQSQSSQPQNIDSPHGIFIHGEQQRLYPQSATATFFPHGKLVSVTISGQFFLYDNTARIDQPFAPPKLVTVQGQIEANLASK